MKRLLIAAGAATLALAPASLRAADAPPPVAIDAARLAAARTTVDFVFPAGTYARVMNSSMDAIIGNMMDSVGKMPLRDLAAIGGLPEQSVATLGDGTLKEIMAIYDPHYQERMQVTTKAMMAEMGKLMTQFEPGIRDGLARAYAKRFTVAQLRDLNAFFATPTGKDYAADSMVIFMDPEVMAKMTAMMPEMMKQMPAIAAKLKDASAALPPPRKAEDLTPDERKRLAALLGVSEDSLGEARDYGLESVK